MTGPSTLTRGHGWLVRELQNELARAETRLAEAERLLQLVLEADGWSQRTIDVLSSIESFLSRSPPGRGDDPDENDPDDERECLG